MNRKLFVAEDSRLPAGSARVDIDSDGVYELFWSVAPNTRGRGIGRRMITVLANRTPGPIRADIKADNETSIRIAKYAGMVYEREKMVSCIIEDNA